MTNKFIICNRLPGWDLEVFECSRDSFSSQLHKWSPVLHPLLTEILKSWGILELSTTVMVADYSNINNYIPRGIPSIKSPCFILKPLKSPLFIVKSHQITIFHDEIPSNYHFSWVHVRYFRYFMGYWVSPRYFHASGNSHITIENPAIFNR
jgi:hypothetical protein